MNATAQVVIDEVKLEQKEATIYQVLQAKTTGGFFSALNWVFKAAWKEDNRTRHFFYRILRVEEEAIMSTDGRRLHLYRCRQNLIPPGDWTVLQLTREIAVLSRYGDLQSPDWKNTFPKEPATRSLHLNLWIPQKKNLSVPYTKLLRAMPADLSVDLAFLEDLRGFDWEVRFYEGDHERTMLHFLNGAKEALVMDLNTGLDSEEKS